MALIGNYSLVNRVPSRMIGASSSLMTAVNYSPHSSLKNRLSAFGQLSGTPYGYLAPMSWVLPNKPGAMRVIANATSVGAATGAAGRGIEASGSSTSVGSVLAGAIVPIVADSTSTSTGSVTMAGAAAIVADGTSTSVGSVSLGGIINILDASGAASSSGACNLTALGWIDASAGGPTPLSPEGLANAVLDALLADHTDPGTVGEALNNVGASSNPWSADLASNTAANTFGERVQRLLTKAQFLSLKD